jgi:signal transduction histidine kinase
MLVFGISDTGIGMTDKEVRELFTQYKQGTQGSLPGTGLGLVVVKGIVETHGGMVGVSSQYDIGTTVYFALPFTA